jgi:hypothetical protein
MKIISLENSFKRFICLGVVFLSIAVSAQALPTITSFSPLTGNVGATVTITGTNFNTTAANNIVFFGATKATVSAATATSLTVTVPAGATYGSLTLVDLSINKTINSKKFFTPTFSPVKGILTAADFSTEQNFSTGTTEPNKIAATGDLDGDGKPDIIIADGSGTNIMLILRNTGGNGTASFETALSINTGGYNTSLAVGDIDGDGKLDIVEVNYNNSSYVKVYLNTTTAVGSISFAGPINLITDAAQYKLRNVAISDLDGDGKADIAVVDNSGSVLLYRNTGSVGTVSFAAKVQYAAGTGPQGIMIGDIDADGLPDLAITNADGGGTSIRVLRNTSTSGIFNFVSSGNFTTGGGPYDLALGDLDGDGQLDIATVNYSGQNVSVLLNTTTAVGAISFAIKTDFAIGRSALKIALGDLNGDGRLDVVITQSGAVMSIFTNTTTTAGSVTFAPMIDIAGTGNSLQAIIGDLDGDGKTDFATGGSKKIIVFHNGDPLANADLKALSISVGTLTPTFTPSTTAYVASSVINTTTSITVTPTQTTSNATATIQVSLNAGSYANVASGVASDPLSLNVGPNTIDVKVTSPDGNTIKTYGITVTREMPVPSYIVSGAGTTAVNGLYTYFGKNSSNKQVWKFGSYYLASSGSSSWIGNDPNSMMMGAQYYVSSSSTDPTTWNMSTYYGSSPAPIIELAAPKVSYASSTLIENSANNGSITATTTITHNNFSSATFTGTDGENFITSGKAVVTGVPAGLTAVITRNNNLQLTFSLTGNANAHANANDISNLTVTFQNSAFSDNDAANTTNYSTNLSINFVEKINVGSGQTYTTIQSAVNASGNGDVLLLAAQTFTEQNITIANKSLTIIGVSPAATIIQANAVAGSATDRVFNITNDSYAETNFNSFEKLTIRHGNVANSNNQDRGGALFASNTTLKLKDCAIESNRVGTTGWGGYGIGGAGVFVQLSNFISENCTYYNNQHTSQSRPGDMMGGGAIAFFTDDTKPNYMKVTNSTFSDNTSGNFGGAIFTRRRPAALNDISITNSTFVGNSAPYGGGYSSMGSSVSPQPTYLTNSLFYGNTASLGGSQMYSNETTNWTVNNCLIESTSAGNLNGVYTNCIVGSDPLLGTLANNGGYTKTYSIGAGSPAINNGTTTSLSLDQRGFSIVGNRDIGAYEYGGECTPIWTGAISTSWNTSGNWYCNVVPDATSDVTIAAVANQPELSNDVTINTLTLDKGTTMKVPTGLNLTVSNYIHNSGTLTVENNANLIQVLGTTNTNTGNIVVNRNSSPLLRLDYTLWSSPVASQNLAAFSPLTSQSPSRFYTYDTATSYRNTFDPTATNFEAGKGYLIRMPNTADAGIAIAYAGQFTGVPNNGDVSFTLSTAGGAYNLVGNPYPSTINLFTLQSNNSTVIGTTFYMWRTTNGAGTAYCSYVPTSTTAGTYVSNGNTQSPVTFVGNIQTGQGFLVSALTTGPLVFKNAQRVTTASSFFKTKQVAAADKVWLNATNAAGDFSQMAVTYFDGATQGIDAFDGKYINDSPLALTSNINNDEYTIQGRPAFDASDVVPLNFKTAAAGNYTIAIDHSEGVFAAGQSVILTDATTGTETDLTTSSYTFTAATGKAYSRFTLKYQKTLGTNKAVFNENSVTVYKNKGTLYVNSGNVAIANIKVYDVQGRLIAELKNVKSTSASISNLKATNQVLVVKITSQDNTVVNKKVVN